MSISWLGTAVLSLLLAGSLVYCALTIVAARRYLASRSGQDPRAATPVSILTPIAGCDAGLEENLRSAFLQDYFPFEIIFAARSPKDPGIPVARKVMAEFPAIPSRLLITGEPGYSNAKVFSLERMMNAARYDLLLMVDSDVRLRRDMLRRIAAEFEDPCVGLATCPYRAVPGKGWCNALEAVGMNTQLLGGVLVARWIEGMKFALGPTIAARRHVIEEFGGFRALGNYLAEDFVMGQLVDSLGYRVILSSCPVEHHIGDARLSGSLAHRLRWARSTRRSRPAGYFGEVFTHPLPIALALTALQPALWPALAVTAVARAAAGWAVAGWVLRDPLTARLWWGVPLQDFIAIGVWVAGFFGKHITWRGRRYALLSDGRFEPVPD
jgi:ceramide glucosyltransferase